ncbi:hypothetical protein [Poriferisphaera sp. WC338]|uniref:hypothetical protein n=1 Tax=Poriferisphaera sp. WC338 TaxID=3425129 RepID=UPI003D813D56
MINHKTIATLFAALSLSFVTMTHAADYIIPSDPNPGTLSNTDTLTLNPTGVINANLTADNNSQVFISGGNLSAKLTLNDNSSANLSAGSAHEIVATDNSILTVTNGTLSNITLKNFAELNLNGGTIDSNFVTFNNASVNVTAGTFNALYQTIDDVQSHITAGIFNAKLELKGQSITTIEGGTFHSNVLMRVKANLDVTDGTFNALLGNSSSNKPLNFSGGTIASTGKLLSTANGSVQVSGGTIDGIIYTTKKTNFIGSNFTLDGIPIADLSHIPTEITERNNAVLAGILADGSAFSYTLNSIIDDASVDYAADDATITVTLIPEPTTAILLSLSTLPLFTRRSRA